MSDSHFKTMHQTVNQIIQPMAAITAFVDALQFTGLYPRRRIAGRNAAEA